MYFRNSDTFPVDPCQIHQLQTPPVLHHSTPQKGYTISKQAPAHQDLFLLVIGSLVAKSGSTLETSWTVACQATLSMGFPRQEYCSGLPFPSPRDLSNPGIELRSPELQADSLLTVPPGKPRFLLPNHGKPLFEGKKMLLSSDIATNKLSHLLKFNRLHKGPFIFTPSPHTPCYSCLRFWFQI